MAQIDVLTDVIRAEVARYYDGYFSDDDDFTTTLRIASDDLSFMAIELEKKFGIRLNRQAYAGIGNVRSFAQAIEAALRDV